MRSIRRREIARLNLTVRALVELSGKFLKSALNSKSSLKMKFRAKFYLVAQGRILHKILRRISCEILTDYAR